MDGKPAATRGMARLAGALYLIIIVAASFAETGARGAVLAGADPAATAANLLESELMYRLGGAAQLLTLLCDVVLAALFYLLFMSAGRALSLTSAGFRFAAIVMMGMNTVFHFAPLMVLQESYLAAFEEPQRQALARLGFEFHSAGYNVALWLFGMHCILLGALIWKSRAVPRLLGLLLAFAGLAYMANSLAFFVHPAFTSYTFPVLVPVALLAEAGRAVWLLVRGMDVPRMPLVRG